jgi:hypothetical protein
MTSCDLTVQHIGHNSDLDDANVEKEQCMKSSPTSVSFKNQTAIIRVRNCPSKFGKVKTWVVHIPKFVS